MAAPRMMLRCADPTINSVGKNQARVLEHRALAAGSHDSPARLEPVALGRERPGDCDAMSQPTLAPGR